MFSTNRESKIWIFITLLSLLIWTLYWTIPSSIERIIDILITGQTFSYESNIGSMYVWMEISGAIGTITRNIGIILGIIALYLLSLKNKSFTEVKKLVSAALFIEAFYYFMVGVPSGTFMTTIGYGGQFVTLGISYFLQFLFTTPFLVILGLQIHRNKQNEIRFLKWVGFAFIGYIAALWLNSVFRWFDMISSDGLSVFFKGLRAVGSLNAFIGMSLAMIFSLVGVYYLHKSSKNTIKWASFALIMIGLHYIIYLVYSYFGGMIGFVLIVEVWAIPLLGLGISIYRDQTSK